MKEVESGEGSSSGLSQKQELLLLAYLDGECGLLAKLWVKSLLARKPEARSYLAGMKEAALGIGEALSPKSIVETNVAGSKPYAPDLWNRISARIEQEQRAEVFLGKRRLVGEKMKVWKMEWAPLGWGFSGAVVAAGLALVMVGLGLVGGSPGSGPVVANLVDRAVQGENVSTVSFPDMTDDVDGASRSDINGGGAQEAGAALVSQRIPAQILPERDVFDSAGESSAGRALNRQVTEVDWMRSPGRVRMIPDPSGNATILWINRNRQPITVGASRLEAIATSNVHQLTPQVSSQSRLRMLEDNLPTAFSAYDR